MANTANITITTDQASGNLNDIFINTNHRLMLSNFQNYLSALNSGNNAGSINVKINTGNAVTASNTVTITAPIAGDSLEINGIAFVAGTNFTIGGTDTITTTNLKNAINASANGLITGLVTASSSGTTLTVSGSTPGVSGNIISLEGKGTGSIAVNGAGANASATLTIVSAAITDTVLINGNTLTAVDDREKTTVTAVAETGQVRAVDITAVADTGAFEVSTVTLGPDIAGSLNSTYFTFSAKNTGGATSTNYYVWYNINGAGVDPAPGGTAIPVTGATGATANTLATATRAAVTSVAGAKVTVTGATNQCIITGKFMGNATNVADGAAPTGFTLTPTNGAASNLNNAYFTYTTRNSGGASTNSRYVWYNVNSEGVDPAPGGTGIAVTLANLATASTVASSTRTAVAADTKVAITGATTHCIITNLYMGVAAGATEGANATGFTFGAVTTGAASILLNKYFVFYSALSATKYYMWFNVNSEGTDPAVAASTAIPIAVPVNQTNSQVAALGRTAFTLSPLITDFVETGATTQMIFQVQTSGVTTATVDTGTTGFTIARTITGSVPSATQFNIGYTDTSTATNLTTVVNAQATLTPIVVATSALGVVTITAIKEGVEGNDITLSATGGNITANHSRLVGGTAPGLVRLTGGVNDTGSKTYNFQR